MNSCEFAIGTDLRGLAVPCGAPAAPGRFAFCAAHRAGLVIKAHAAFLKRQTAAPVVAEDDDDE